MSSQVVGAVAGSFFAAASKSAKRRWPCALSPETMTWAMVLDAAIARSNFGNNSSETTSRRARLSSSMYW
jgi:hypothetical protein